MVSPIVIDVIMHPYEERNIEFKTSTPWNDKSFKAKIAKSILGMANIRDGGWIVIGKVRQPDDTHEAVGMTQTDYESYSSDLLKDFVKNYAAPHVEISLEKPEYAQKKFVVIRVEEFDDVPVICKKDCGDVLHQGRIYTRSHGKPETIEVPSYPEMREIITMATEKEIRHFYERISRSGATVKPIKPDDKESFDKQLGGLI